MHVCVIGGAGAIAEAVIDRYLADCDDVTAVYRTKVPVYIGTPIVSQPSLVKGPVDVLITLPGAVENNRLEKLHLQAWENVLDANLTSVYDALHHILPKMAKNGSIVVVGSIVASTGGYGCANYAAAKAGLEGLVRAAANENTSLRINLLQLGYVNAGMGKDMADNVRVKIETTIPMRRFAELGEVVDAIQFLASQTYMTGNTLTFAGGLR